MPKITVPADAIVEIPQPDGTPDLKKPMTFGRDFVVRVLLADPQWGASVDDLFACMSIRGAFASAAPGQVVEIAKDHLAKLQERMRRPSGPYNPTIAAQLGAFFDAVLKPEE